MTEEIKMLLKPFIKMYPEQREKFPAASKAGAVNQEFPEVRWQPAVPSPGCLILLKNYKFHNSSFEMSLWSCWFPIFAPSLGRKSNPIFLNCWIYTATNLPRLKGQCPAAAKWDQASTPTAQALFLSPPLPIISFPEFLPRLLLGSNTCPCNLCCSLNASAKLCQQFHPAQSSSVLHQTSLLACNNPKMPPRGIWLMFWKWEQGAVYSEELLLLYL